MKRKGNVLAVKAFEKAPQITTQIRPSPPGTLSPENRETHLDNPPACFSPTLLRKQVNGNEGRRPRTFTN